MQENDDNAETKRVATLYRAFGRRLTFNKRYYFLYLVCLYANAFILVGVIYVVDRFFNGNFVDYGRDFLTFYLATPEVQKTMINPIDKASNFLKVRAYTAPRNNRSFYRRYSRR